MKYIKMENNLVVMEDELKHIKDEFVSYTIKTIQNCSGKFDIYNKKYKKLCVDMNDMLVLLKIYENEYFLSFQKNNFYIISNYFNDINMISLNQYYFEEKWKYDNNILSEEISKTTKCKELAQLIDTMYIYPLHEIDTINNYIFSLLDSIDFDISVGKIKLYH